MRARTLGRLARLEQRLGAGPRVGGMVRVPTTVGWPPPGDWAPPGGWPRGGYVLVPEAPDPETWLQRAREHYRGRAAGQCGGT